MGPTPAEQGGPGAQLAEVHRQLEDPGVHRLGLSAIGKRVDQLVFLGFFVSGKDHDPWGPLNS